MDHKVAVASHMLKKLAERASAEKRYRVTVEFAHGVRHVFDGVDEDTKLAMERWSFGVDQWFADTWFVYVDESVGTEYHLNRDYLCSMVVEEADE